MILLVFQPPYPKEGTVAAAESCLGWMQNELDALRPGEQDLILLPEYATAPGLADREQIRAFALRCGQVFLQRAAATAVRLNCALALAAPIASGRRWFNRTIVYGPEGQTVGQYDKIHLTEVERDELELSPGHGATVGAHKGLRIGFATCFDQYFPEHFEVLAAQRVDLILCPSYQRSETAARIRLIGQARALDAGAYVARSSYSMGRQDVGGRSLIASPEGELLGDAGPAPGLLRVELDPRRKFIKPASHGRAPVEHRALIEAHRRPYTYRSVIHGKPQPMMDSWAPLDAAAADPEI